MLDRSRLLIGPAICRYLQTVATPAQVAALPANGFPSDFSLHEVAGRAATTPALVDLWLEQHRNPAAVARLRPLSPTLIAAMRERVCSTLLEVGLISAPDRSMERTQQVAAVLGTQGIPFQQIPWGACFLLPASGPAFRLLVMAPAPADRQAGQTEPILFERTAEDRIIVPASWMRGKLQALVLNQGATPESRVQAHALLDLPVGDAILPPDVETVMAPIADTSGTVRYEALPGGCVIALGQ